MNEADFIKTNKHKSIAELALILNKKPNLDASYILAQINGIQKSKHKLPEFHNNPQIIYPPKLSLEQCSSEKTAVYKSKLIKGNQLVDLTGGFGIDCFYFSKEFQRVTYVEQNEELYEVVKANFQNLEAHNIDLVNTTAETFLKLHSEQVDVVYIDPDRRNENQRVYKLDECQPNIIDLAPDIFKITDKILIKTAPLLDIKQSIRDLPGVTKVWVISVDNECKEVLYLLEKNKTESPVISAINLVEIHQEFQFNFEEESAFQVPYSDPLNYIYEPNASILKAGAFNCICGKYAIKKLAPNTHLYTSENKIDNFPGRTFQVKHLSSYQYKEFRKLKITKANVSCRNFKDKPEKVKKKLKLNDGGETYLFATTNRNRTPILIISTKV